MTQILSLTPHQILSACPIFRAIPHPSLLALLQTARLIHSSADSLIFRQNAPCPGVFIVGSGLVRIYKSAPSGKEHVLHLVGPSHTFGEVAAIGNFPCPAFAQALEPTTLALLPAQPFRELLDTDPQLAKGLLLGMASWVKHMVNRVEDLTLRDATGRLARYLLSIASPTHKAHLPTLKRHLASHLNLTSETLSRTLRKLTDDNLIALDGDTLHLLNPTALQTLTESPH